MLNKNMLQPETITVKTILFSRFDINAEDVEYSQRVPVETINFKKRIKTFKFLNQNKRWQNGVIDIDSDYIFYREPRKSHK